MLRRPAMIRPAMIGQVTTRTPMAMKTLRARPLKLARARRQSIPPTLPLLKIKLMCFPTAPACSCWRCLGCSEHRGEHIERALCPWRTGYSSQRHFHLLRFGGYPTFRRWLCRMLLRLLPIRPRSCTLPLLRRRPCLPARVVCPLRARVCTRAARLDVL
jgi:hypothetical protein